MELRERPEGLCDGGGPPRAHVHSMALRVQLAHWACELGVADLLDRALGEAGLG